MSVDRRNAVQKPYEGAILIADITGYSQFLNESELTHAEKTLTELLELLVTNTRPPLVVSKLEGDAVLSYLVDGGSLEGQAFVEVVEAAYTEFRKALELMVLNTTCKCNACANIGNLDLKFFVHHGEFMVSDIAGRQELQGSDVNLLHRLAKNTVTADTGIRAYVIYTQQAVDALGLEDVTAAMVEHVASYDDVGEVETRVEDLQPVWEKGKARTRIEVTPTEALIDISTFVHMPLEMVWGYLIDPVYRNTLIGSDRQEVVETSHGRVAEGSVYQCYHGDKMVPQIIVEWDPPERMVTRDLVKMGGANMAALAEYQLDREGDGTRFTKRATFIEGSRVIRGMARFVFPMMRDRLQNDIVAFRDHIEGAYAESSSALSS